MRHASDYWKEKFGCKVYRIAINGGFTCPNRDGTLGTRGCIFCSAGGSGEFAGDPKRSVTEQIEEGKKRVSSKIRSGAYIAYFQAYTNTYASTDRLREMFTEAICHPDIVGLSVATRPDCLPEPVLTLLSELNRIKPVSVELGLQTSKEETARYIRRGYPLSVYDDAVRELKSRGIEVITHVILGLPGETEVDMAETVRHACLTGTDGIKLQLLHVLRGTDLYQEYLAGRVPVMELPEYIEVLKACLAVIPEHVVIHRLTGDGDKKLLVAPMWSADKKRVLNRIKKEIG